MFYSPSAYKYNSFLFNSRHQFHPDTVAKTIKKSFGTDDDGKNDANQSAINLKYDLKGSWVDRNGVCPRPGDKAVCRFSCFALSFVPLFLSSQSTAFPCNT
jgi:hypothetical protein